MKTKTFNTLLRSASRGVKKHSPELLLAVGIVGLVSAGVSAVMATPKALKNIEDEKKRQYDEALKESVVTHSDTAPDPIEKLKPVDAMKVTWKCYLPSVITGGLSIACLIESNSVHAKRNAALMSAYTLSESLRKEYQEKAAEIVGEKKEKAIRDAVAQEHVKQNPPQNNEVIITKKGETLCYDHVSGRYFKSDIDKIKSAGHELNTRLRSEMYVSLNDMYYEWGLPQIELGDMLGWNIDDGYIEFDFSSGLTEDGTPYLAIGYMVGPRYDYENNY